jgi:hypothetical protein
MELVPEVSSVTDEDLKIAEKALQTFNRSTFVAEGTFKLRLGVNAHHFEHDVLPKLLRAGILVDARPSAAKKYKLGVPLAAIADALAKCKGSFAEFLKLVMEGIRSKP